MPASRYQISWRNFPETLPPIEYGSSDEVRRVQDKGTVYYRGKRIAVGKAFRGYPIAFRATTEERVFDVYFCQHRITQIDLSNFQ